MTVLAVLTALALENTLPSFYCSYKIHETEATVTVLTVLVVLAVSVMMATPLGLEPPFSVILNYKLNYFKFVPL